MARLNAGRFATGRFSGGRFSGGRFGLTASAAPIITATALPTMGPLNENQTPANGYTAGSYASSAGTRVSATPTYLVNGAPQPGTFDLVTGQTVQASVLVTDSVGNTRTFATSTVTVTAVTGADEAETTAFIAAAAGRGGTAFTTGQRAALNSLFAGLKADGLMAGKLVRLFTSNMPDAITATQDLTDPNRLLTALGSAPSWAKEGWKADDANGRGYSMGDPTTMGLTLTASGLFM